MGRARRDGAACVSWKIAVYIRLSKEDGREESRSVTEQRKILSEFVSGYFSEQHVVVGYYVDDGLTGTDDTRDDFRRMMEDAYAGRVNCIVCKTLSRAFRNYADQGRYLEQVFPAHGIRFVSMGNPRVDSYTDSEAIQHGLEIPINGLMNDRFAAKTSADVRRTFEAKRRRGEFIGAFAPYGYAKSPHDRHKLVVDEQVCGVVGDIYSWFVNEGMSKRGIAKRLNGMGVPNPTEYKRSQGLSYHSPNMAMNDGKWSESVVARILKNQVYIGDMVQGRQRVISYKVHTAASVPREEWVVVKNTHPPIVARELFEKAQALHALDTRAASGKHEVYLFSGLLRCNECKKAMRRKSSKGYVYYQCRTKVDKGGCSKHTVREDRLERAVLEAIRCEVAAKVSAAEVAAAVSASRSLDAPRVAPMRRERLRELQRVSAAKDALYMDWKNGDITREEYSGMKARFGEREAWLREAVAAIESKDATGNQQLEDFSRCGNVTALTRGLVVTLIDAVYVHENGDITLCFNHA